MKAKKQTVKKSVKAPVKKKPVKPKQSKTKFNKLSEIALSPSQAALWQKCPGSLFITKPKSFKDNTEADEGTFIHALCEMAASSKYLTSERDNIELKNVKEKYKLLPDIEKKEIDSMVDFYMHHLSYYLEIGHSWVEFEYFVSDKIKGVKFAGTADCVIVNQEERKITVIDLKTGFTPVSARMNSQLLIYAHLMAKTEKLKDYNFNLVITQPRTRTVDSWAGRISDTYLETIAESITRAFQLSDSKKLSALNPGGHCQYCPVKFNCSALRREIDKILNPETLGEVSNDPDFWDYLTSFSKVVETMMKDTKKMIETYHSLVDNDPKNKKAGKQRYKMNVRNVRRAWMKDLNPELLAKALNADPDILTEKKPISVTDLDSQLTAAQKERAAAFMSMITSTSFEPVANESEDRKKEKEFEF